MMNMQRVRKFWRQLAQVNWYNVGTSSVAIKVSLLGLVSVFLGVFSWLFIISPMQQKLQALRSHEENLIQEYQENHQNINHLQALTSSNIQQNEQLQQQLEKLPKTVQMAQLTQWLKNIATHENVQLMSVNVMPMQEKTYFTQRGLAVVAVGEYHQLGRFLHALFDDDWLLSVDDFSLTQTQMNKLQLQMQINTYQAKKKSALVIVDEE